MQHIHQRVFLIRHAQTKWSVTGQHTGKTDLPLTEDGEGECLFIKERLQNQAFQKVWVSPLQRAKRTCEIAGLFGKAQIDNDLVEWDYGSYEGWTTLEIHKIHPTWNLFIDGAKDGESIADISHRASKVLISIKATPGDVAIFSSGHFLRVLAAKWLGLAPQFGMHLTLSTASISILGYEKNTPVIALWNQTGN